MAPNRYTLADHVTGDPPRFHCAGNLGCDSVWHIEDLAPVLHVTQEPPLRRIA